MRDSWVWRIDITRRLLEKNVPAILRIVQPCTVDVIDGDLPHLHHFFFGQLTLDDICHDDIR